jgi:hypothetical protein
MFILNNIKKDDFTKSLGILGSDKKSFFFFN